MKPHLDSLVSLPEIAAALAGDAATNGSIEGLKRAVQIFEAMDGPLHTAVLALLADAHQQAGQYQEAILVLEQLLHHDAASPTTIQLALSKANFYKGDFDQALQIVCKLLDTPQVQASVLARGTLLTVQGTIQLLQLNRATHDYEAAQQVIKVLRVAAKSLEGHEPAAAAAAYNNLGVAQIVAEQTFLDSHVRVDGAMTCFHEALNLASGDDFLRGRIYNNMAMTLLLEELDDDDDMLQLASEYARDALSIYEKSKTLPESEKQAGLGRALSLVASCYVIADAAVTAEGLFQTAIDTKGVDPLTTIARREAYHNYSELCNKWDKRDADATRLGQQSAEINGSLSEGWKDKPAIVSGLLFNTL